MVAPLSQASNNSTGMSGYTSSCGEGASTSAYVGTQQLSLLPGCSSSGMGEIQRSTGSTIMGSSATFTLGADVDIHSEIHYTYKLPSPDGTGGAYRWCDMVGVKMIKSVTIKVGTSVWETIERPAMLAMAQLEMSGPDYNRWSTGMNGLVNAPVAYLSNSAAATTSTSPQSGGATGGGKLMCCVKGGYRGQLFVAAMPYQSITVKINFEAAVNCLSYYSVPGSDMATQFAAAAGAAAAETNFTLYTKQHILSPYERGLMQSTDILQLLSTTHYYQIKHPITTKGGESTGAIDLSFLNDYCTHIAVWVTAGTLQVEAQGGGKGLASQLDPVQAALGTPIYVPAWTNGDSVPHQLTNVEFIYNGTSAQGKQPDVLLAHSSMMGLDNGGLIRNVDHIDEQGTSSYHANPNVSVFQLANTPCVSSLSTSQSQFASFAGGDGVANNRYDVIQFKATAVNQVAGTTAAGMSGLITDLVSDLTIHFVAFGAQSVLYSAGGAVKN